MVKSISNLIIKIICLSICLLAIVLVLLNSREVEKIEDINENDIQVRSKDKLIELTFDANQINKVDYIDLSVICDNEIQKRDIASQNTLYEYRDGEPGKLYTFEICYVYNDGTKSEVVNREALFLDYDELPELPIIVIDTEDGQEPAYEKAKKPKDMWGSSIDNNEYVNANLEIKNGIDFSSEVQVKIRGNSSSIDFEKKSYKLEFETACNLSSDSNTGLASEWILLNIGNELKSYVGEYVGQLCGMEWNPHMEFVNVVMNGDWKGCYYLTKAIGYEGSEGLLSQTGVIIENDAYWWKAKDKGAYFRLENQVEQMAYTFKYPKIDKSNSELLYLMENRMQTLENLIMAGDEKYSDYFDKDVAVSWFLSRDIMGNADSGGSNLFFYLADYNDENSKIKMGPLWDLDSVYENTDDWSDCRNEFAFHFYDLYKIESFREAYLNRWKNVEISLCDDIYNLLDMPEDQQEAINKSWLLEEERWKLPISSYYQQKEDTLDWFRTRIDWMDAHLDNEM